MKKNENKTTKTTSQRVRETSDHPHRSPTKQEEPSVSDELGQLQQAYQHLRRERDILYKTLRALQESYPAYRFGFLSNQAGDLW